MKSIMIVSAILTASALTPSALSFAGEESIGADTGQPAPPRLRLIELGENPAVGDVVTELQTLSGGPQPELTGMIERLVAPEGDTIEALNVFVGARNNEPVVFRLNPSAVDMYTVAEEHATWDKESPLIKFPRSKWSRLYETEAAEDFLRHAGHPDSELNEMRLAILFDKMKLGANVNEAQTADRLQPEEVFTEAAGISGREVVVIAPGQKEVEFTMGSRPDDKFTHYSEMPQHTVKIITGGNGLAIYAGKLTRLQYYSIMNPDVKVIKNPYHSMTDITFYDAKRFIERAEMLTGIELKFLSEAIREYATRAGTPTLWPFSFGFNLKKQIQYYAVHGQTLNPKIQDVGTKWSNPFHLFDMHGLTWEWTQDTWHDSYEGAPADGSAWGDEDDLIRAARGGSWEDRKFWRLRSANRRGANAHHRAPDMGVRFMTTVRGH